VNKAYVIQDLLFVVTSFKTGDYLLELERQ